MSETNLEASAAITPKSTDLQCRHCKAWVGPDERVDDGEGFNPRVLCNSCDTLRTAQTWARMIVYPPNTREGNVVRIYAIDGGGDYPIHGAVLHPDSTGNVWEPEGWALNANYNLRSGYASGMDLMVDFEFDDEVRHAPSTKTNCARSARHGQKRLWSAHAGVIRAMKGAGRYDASEDRG